MQEVGRALAKGKYLISIHIELTGKTEYIGHPKNGKDAQS